jgi:sulfite reductase (NADPH) hemoprotein beta-component
MGRTDNEPRTYPRLADVIGFIPKDRLFDAADAVMGVQRDFGNRVERPRARFKYTVDDKGLDWVKGEIERRLGQPLAPARPFEFTTNGDPFGWRETPAGRFNCTLFIENGRVSNLPGRNIMDGIRAVAKVHKGAFRLTPNQNLIIADIAPEDRPAIEAILAEHGLSDTERTSALRLNSIACVALPTCPLAMAEAERYLPSLVGKIEEILAANGLSDDPITIRASGCPNGCSRPYVAEIALTGRAPGKYNLYLGGGFHGERLNRLYRENIGEAAILDILSESLGRYARERTFREPFGDFLLRAGYFEASADLN